MKTPGFNPYLPSWEFVPDGEPHVFDNRIYIYGSHDRRNGTAFCQEDYVVWSAPVEDPGNWRYEGISYRKMQDPLNGAPYAGKLPQIDLPVGTPEDPRLLYAPDVARGPDGRYYLYYSLDFTNVVSVAVSEHPAGPFRFLDFVRTRQGEIPDFGRWFDPAILCEDSGNYLYYGFAPAVRFPGMEGIVYPGASMVRLADDMHTIISDPVCVANGVDTARGTSFEAHPFFEASSIRRIRGRYYFVYSSLQGNELCYATASSPEGPFEYRGVIISNGDLGYRGNTLAVNYTGNNHGGLVEIGDETYIFWHRQTHGTGFCRQGCADRVQILPDGTIPQVPVTSCGLNRGPLPARGTYQTFIACHLTERNRAKVGHVLEPGPGEPLPALPPEMPFITEEECPGYEKNLKPFISNMATGAAAGFKYLEFTGEETGIAMELRGKGRMALRTGSPEGEIIAVAACDSGCWMECTAGISALRGVQALYFTTLEGTLDFASFTIS